MLAGFSLVNTTQKRCLKHWNHYIKCCKGTRNDEEQAFANAFGRELTDAYEWVLNFRRTKDITNLNQAWDIYYNVFRRVSKQVQLLASLELQYVSPDLEHAQDLELAVPGTYQAGKPVIRIIKFDPTFSIISSKQRPRNYRAEEVMVKTTNMR